MLTNPSTVSLDTVASGFDDRTPLVEDDEHNEVQSYGTAHTTATNQEEASLTSQQTEERMRAQSTTSEA